MPELAYADFQHAEKYRGPGEDFRECANRVAAALHDDEGHRRRFRDAFLAQRTLPAGRVQAAAGSPRRITAFNCFVLPCYEDSFTDGENSIMAVNTKVAQTLRMGGGVGLSFSRLRPRGDQISTLGSRSSGPVSFMDIPDAVCRATMSAGHRRGALMGVLDVHHPDVEEFVRAKQTPGRLTGFNVSVAATDEFMAAVRDGRDHVLRFGGRERGRIDARALWEEIMRGTWDHAEPGVLFIDTINRLNNLYYCETVHATNPCGEQPLPPNGACLLGSLNLVKFLRPDFTFDWGLLAGDAYDLVRALDNVIDRTTYPLPEQEAEAKAKRRLGVGVTGLANVLEVQGAPYGSPAFLEREAQVMKFIRDACYRSSVLLAQEKGAFPLFDRDAYLEGAFVRTLPQDIRDGIARHGVRNSHLTSVAPTGTISFCADNVSSGVEPPWALEYQRRVRDFDGEREQIVQDYAWRVWGVRGKTATECTVDEHLDVLATAQRYVDSAVSKTINVDPATPWEDFKRVYSRAWELGCKGCTTFNPAGKREGIFKVVEEDAACRVDPETGARSCE